MISTMLFFPLFLCFVGTRSLDLDYTDSYSMLKSRISHIQSKCGEVCNTDIKASAQGLYYEEVQKNFECQSLFKIEEEPSEFVMPPRKIPKFLKKYYSYNDRILISEFFLMNASPSIFHEEIWTKESIEGLRKDFRNNIMRGAYGIDAVNDIATMIRNYGNTKDARVLVIGSESPWIEAMLLELGAREVITLEYSEIQTDHSSIHPVLPEKFNEDFLSGVLEPFDLTVSFSSLEHSGLGRYGDPLNPWGDLITMAKVWCATRTGGRAIIGVPTGVQDEIIFNAAKIYGPIQYGHLFANWKPVFSNSDPSAHYDPNCKWCYQPLFVLEK